MNGNYIKITNSSTVPQIDEATALSKALLYVNAQKYSWQDSNMEKYIKQNTGDTNATYYPVGKLIFCNDALQAGTNWKLSWNFTICSLDPYNEQSVFVDANNGQIINVEGLIALGNAPGRAETVYSGSQQVTTDSYSGGYRLRENRNSVSTAILNVHGTTDPAFATDFSDNDNFWQGLEHYGDQDALDLHWGIEKTLDYWRTVRLRNSYDGNNAPVTCYAHWGNHINFAGWAPTTKTWAFGDGDGTTYTGWTSLDICAHEFAHGVNQTTANLPNANIYSESSALNEGLSDIWAAAVIIWAAPTKDPWNPGSEANVYHNPTRSVNNPNSVGYPRYLSRHLLGL